MGALALAFRAPRGARGTNDPYPGGGGGSPPAVAPWPAADFYVSPSGSSSNNGSLGAPWSLAYALAGAGGTIQPGDVVEMLPGTYSGNYSSTLQGTVDFPIIVRAQWRTRAKIDGTLVCQQSGRYTWFWGLEVMRSAVDANIIGVNSFGLGNRFIHCIIHDHPSNGLGMWSEGTDQEAYGNIIYNNGYSGQDPSHAAHGIYSQNIGGTKKILDNILFNQYGYGIHVYGTEAVHLDNYTIEGNASYNNGVGNSVSLSGGLNFLISGGNPPVNLVFRKNYGWVTAGFSDTGGRFGDNFDDTAGEGAIFEDNVFMGAMLVCYFTSLIFQRNQIVTRGDYLAIELFRRAGQTGPAGVWNDNAYFNTGSAAEIFLLINSLGTSDGAFNFAGWKSQTGLDGASTLASGEPTVNRIVVRPSAYETGRGHVYVYNWQSLGAVDVDLSAVLEAGDTYEILDAQDFFGAPVKTGTYAGGNLSIAIAAKTPPASPSGLGVMPTTGIKFKAFVVRRTGAAA